MKSYLPAFFLIVCLSSCTINNRIDRPGNSKGYIGISKVNPSYFSFDDGSPYIPVGINMISPSGRFRNDPDSALKEMEGWMKSLSMNGGNYIRVWLSSPYWDVEAEQAGKYNESKAGRIDTLFKLAAKYNLRIKLTLEHFRSLTMEENPQQWAVKSVYHKASGGPLESVRDYLSKPEGHKLFLDLADYYMKRYGTDTLFFGLELWNEMNAVSGPADSTFMAWNVKMLDEVKQRFPQNLVMQSLGSFDNDNVRKLYRNMMLLKGNEVAQVYRYLDPGAPMNVCQAPMDIICSSAIEEIRSYNPAKPVILAETGAVESRHSGPSRFYAADTSGMLLHDILFAPFFAGSAGAGMSWHWDQYVAANNLWYHFGRFSNAVKDINPLAENFIPSRYESGNLRIYRLTGKKTTLMWLRDINNNWETELRDGKLPQLLSGVRLDISNTGSSSSSDISIYDPWQDKTIIPVKDGMSIILPDFTRSLVVRIIR